MVAYRGSSSTRTGSAIGSTPSPTSRKPSLAARRRHGRQITPDDVDGVREVRTGAGAELYLPPGFDGQPAVEATVGQLPEQHGVAAVSGTPGAGRPSAVPGVDHQQFQFEPRPGRAVRS